VDHDQALVARARAGDQGAHRELFDRHAPYVFRVLDKFVAQLNCASGTPILESAEVRELTAELTTLAFGEAFANLGLFDATRSSFSTWTVWKGRARLRQVVEPAIRERVHRDLGIEVESLEDLPSHLRESYLPDPWRSDPETVVLIQERRTEYWAKIEAALRVMPPEQATALVLVFVTLAEEGQGRIQVAAARTGRSPDAMDSLLRRAVQRFRQEWEQRFGTPAW
jgi:DNA-directed RNA polymerase specialized sigma24 family protein